MALSSISKKQLGPLALWAVLLAGCVHYEPRPLAPEQTAAAFESRTLASPEVRDYLAVNIGRDFVEWPPKEWDFEMLTWVAFHFHPSLDVARAQWDVAQGGIRTAAGRPNPTVGVTPGYNFHAASGVSPWFPGMTVDVPIETAGKRAKRVAQSRQLAEAAHQNVFTAAWLVRAELRRALLDATAAERRGHALRELATLQQGTVALLEQRRQAGAVSTLDVSTARVALARAEADAGDAERLAATSRSRLAQALGVPLAALTGQRLTDPFADPAPSFSAEGLAAARRQCLQSRPDILVALATYEASQAALQLEIAKQYPDLHLGSGYQWDQGDNKWNLALTLDLPILNRNEGPIAEAEARRREAATQVVAAQARVIAELDAAQAEMAASAAQIAGLEKVDAALRRQAALVHQQLEAGGADRLEEQGAQLELAVGRLALLDARTKAVQAAGLLEDALRIPFANLRSVENDPRPPAHSQNP
jgi:outer membrane protein, heavy metal efflux system